MGSLPGATPSADGATAVKADGAAPAVRRFNLPMHFEKNGGQTDSQVEFLSRGPGYTVYLTSTQAVLSLSGKNSRFDHSMGRAMQRDAASSGRPQADLRMTLAGANPHPGIEGTAALPGTASYFVGNDSRAWKTAISLFGRVDYREVYPGIDVAYYGNQRQLEYDFVVRPGGKPEDISLRFEGENECRLDEQGELVVQLSGGAVRWQKPFAYQTTAVGRQQISASYVIRSSHEVGFKLGTYDATRPLVIDPALVYAAYLGGNDSEFLSGVAADSSGNVYVVGDTLSLNFPTHTPYRGTAVGSNDVFISKLNSSGSALVYSTYLGGNGNDYAGGIAVDSSGNVYVAGTTESLNFPTKNAAYSGNAGFRDAFIAKLGPFGTNLVYASYLGGSSDDNGSTIAVDNSGKAYIAGDTYSSGTGNGSFPTAPNNAFQRNNNGGRDAFVAKFDTTLVGSSSLIYSTFLGGVSDDKANAIAIDSAGNAFITGEIDSYPQFPVNQPPIPPLSDFPMLNALIPSYNNGYTDPYTAGTADGFLTKLNASGTGLVFSTFLGGADNDAGLGVTVDASGRAYVIGESGSVDFPTTTNAVQPFVSGGDSGFPAPDAFIMIFQTNGALAYSTFLGGSDYESGSTLYRFGIAVDNFGDIYVAGQTRSIDDFPITTAFDITNSNAQALAFAAKINPAVPGFNGLVYSAMFGGDTFSQGGLGAENRATAIAIDPSGNFYVAGFTSATNFPTTAGYDPSFNGGFSDAFVTKFGSPADLSVSMVPSIEPVLVGSNLTYTIYVNNNGRTMFTGVTNVVQFSTNAPILAVSNSVGNWRTNGNQLIFNIGTMTNNASVIGGITIGTSIPQVMSNTASVTGVETASQELNTGNNLEVVLSTVRGIADVRLTASVFPEPVVVSSNLTYTFTVQNKGPIWPATQIVMTDALPAQLSFVSATSNNLVYCFNDPLTGIVTCNVAAQTNGGSVSFNIVATALTNGVITNIATVTAFELDGIPGNNTVSFLSTATSQTDLGLLMSGPGTSLAGANLTYSLTVTNLGPAPAGSVAITDPLPPGTVFVSATTSQGSYSQSNNIVTCNLGLLQTNSNAQVTITVTPMLTGNITNTASVSNLLGADLAILNNTASVKTVINPAADLAVSQIATPASIVVQSNVSLSITVTNRGPSTAVNARLTNTVPSGLNILSFQSPPGISCTQSGGTISCNCGSLTNTASAVITIQARGIVDGSFLSVATVAMDTPDLNTNNTGSATVTVTPNPDAPVLKISRSAGNVILSWPTATLTNYFLQANSNFVSTSWAPVTNVPRTGGGQYFVTNSIGGSRNSYRLLKGP